MIPSRKHATKTRQLGMLQRVNRSDGRSVEICRTERQWQERRSEVCERAYARCEVCFRIAPCHDVLVPGTEQIRWKAGHAHHKLTRKAGGGSRNDALNNLVWLCEGCHAKVHVPEKVVPAKVGA